MPAPGFRLQSVEIRNWGTFDERIWAFETKGENALLTGEVGSGKSTLVDAITTLLVPAHRVAYNRAAGAEARERTLRSYVLGHYKSERGEETGAKPVPLRTERGVCSVILARLGDAVTGDVVTLVQVAWFREAAQPDRFYVVADEALSIKEHFSDFGPEISALRKQLRQRQACEQFQAFTEYGAAFRRRLGIESDQALELFHQTVSMKAVGNLTDFVRTHMLEEPNVDPKIDALLAHFEDLDRAHEAVVNARQQIEQLIPIREDSLRWDVVQASQVDFQGCSTAIPAWLADRRLPLIAEHRERLAAEQKALASERAGCERRVEDLSLEATQLAVSISQNGGARLEQIEQQLIFEGRELQRRAGNRERFNQLCTQAGVPIPQSADDFLAGRQAAGHRRGGLQPELQELENKYADADFQVRTHQQREREVETELTELKTHQTNIPAPLIQVRRQLLADLGGVNEVDLPYAGELLRIKPGQEAWQVAVERVLHGFGISLLVPTKLYAAVSQWVDDHPFHGILFRYYAVSPVRLSRMGFHQHSLYHKIEIQQKPDVNWCREWMIDRIAQSYDYACCDTLEQFRREDRALSINGQVKQGDRHEKDGRDTTRQRRNFVLGWTNEDKKKALTEALEEIRKEGLRHLQAKDVLYGQRQRLQDQLESLKRLLETGAWGEIDTAERERKIAGLRQEQAAIEGSSSILSTLQEQLKAVKMLHAQGQQVLLTLAGREATAADQTKQADARFAQTASLRDSLIASEREVWFQRLTDLMGQRPEERPLVWDGTDNLEMLWQRRLRTLLNELGEETRALQERLVNAMTRFQSRWPTLTAELDPTTKAGEGYRSLLRQLEEDDLPRFQKDFQGYLRENTINDIASLQAKLDHEQDAIRKRIQQINVSLRGIDYNPGRYIELIASQDPDPDPEIAEFRRQLRACTENVLGEQDEGYSESKFEQVQAIIKRFKGRDTLAEVDRRWRAKVADVRNWSLYAASERFRLDDVEHDHIENSSGKSGGQKEKLAYTVLAASIAYRYGLGSDTARRSFRFVVIDEAFGRGSDESARFGLELFRTLGLQLLIATPLQKIRVIEPYVSTFGFVSNDGKRSSIRTLTMEEYQAERRARRET